MLGAAQEGGLEEMSSLLTKRVNPNICTLDGWTALHRSAKYTDRPDVIRILLDARAAVDAKNNDGCTPLYLSIQQNHSAAAAHLLESGAAVDATTSKGFTALHSAADRGRCAVAALLLDCGASVDAISDLGFTPLHLAAQNGHCVTSALLLDHGAAVNATNALGATPLQLPAQKGHTNVVSLLLKRCARPDVFNRELGWTPLMEASYFGHEDVVRLLLSYNANPTLTARRPAGPDKSEYDCFGQTALHIAVGKEHDAVVNLLREALTEQKIPQSNIAEIHPEGSCFMELSSFKQSVLELTQRARSDPAVTVAAWETSTAARLREYRRLTTGLQGEMRRREAAARALEKASQEAIDGLRALQMLHAECRALVEGLPKMSPLREQPILHKKKLKKCK